MPSTAAAAGGLGLGQRGVDLDPRLVAGDGQLGDRPSVSASCAESESTVPCASSSFSMISSSASSSEVIRRSSDTSSCCMRSRSLGLVISPWSIRSRSRVRRALTCSTSASALFCSTVRSSTTMRASRRLVAVSRGRSPARRSRRSRAARPAGAAAGRHASRAPARRGAAAGRTDRPSSVGSSVSWRTAESGAERARDRCTSC